MRCAVACLGGSKSWRGEVRGFFGLLRRRFTIFSLGHADKGAFSFHETMKFDDGEPEKRQWNFI